MCSLDQVSNEYWSTSSVPFYFFLFINDLPGSMFPSSMTLHANVISNEGFFL